MACVENPPTDSGLVADSNYGATAPGARVIPFSSPRLVAALFAGWVLGSMSPHRAVAEALPAEVLEALKGRDAVEAFDVMERYASRGNSIAQLVLGISLSRPEFAADLKAAGIPVDRDASPYWLRTAAESGDLCSMTMVGALYASGTAVPRDLGLGVDWLARAAERGGPTAQEELMQLYHAGKYQPRSEEESTRLTLETARRGLVVSRARAADLYLNGTGVPRDVVEAYKWTDLAVSADPSDRALQQRKAGIAALMNPAQLAEAQSRVRTWVPKKGSECDSLFDQLDMRH